MAIAGGTKLMVSGTAFAAKVPCSLVAVALIVVASVLVPMPGMPVPYTWVTEAGAPVTISGVVPWADRDRPVIRGAAVTLTSMAWAFTPPASRTFRWTWRTAFAV